jgi:hypothetical protein
VIVRDGVVVCGRSRARARARLTIHHKFRSNLAYLRQRRA